MRLTNFTFDSSIEIGISGRPRFIDLHNIYCWQSVTYFPEQRQISMSWALPADADIRADLPSVVTLEFRGVSRFAASPHDREMPYDEDTCLDSVTISQPEQAANPKNEFRVFRGNSEHITFAFRSGFSLKIWAEEAELIYGRDA